MIETNYSAVLNDKANLYLQTCNYFVDEIVSIIS